MPNPFPFTAGQVLTAAQMNGIGEPSTAFTPTLTGASLGNGTLNCSFMRVNKMVKANYTFTIGSTSTITASLFFSLPVTGLSSTAQSTQIVATGLFTDVSAGIDYICMGYYTTTTVGMIALNSASTYLNIGGQVNGTVPVAPATGDILRLQVIYEAA